MRALHRLGRGRRRAAGGDRRRADADAWSASPTLPGVVRSWTSVDDFVQEVANARIYDGVHYRNSTEVGTAMGKKIGAMAAANALRPGN